MEFINLLSELIVALIIPMLGGIYYNIRKSVLIQSKLKQLEKELVRIEERVDKNSEVCRQGRIVLHEEVKALSREVSKIQGYLDK